MSIFSSDDMASNFTKIIRNIKRMWDTTIKVEKLICHASHSNKSSDEKEYKIALFQLEYSYHLGLCKNADSDFI